MPDLKDQMIEEAQNLRERTENALNGSPFHAKLKGVADNGIVYQKPAMSHPARSNVLLKGISSGVLSIQHLLQEIFMVTIVLPRF